MVTLRFEPRHAEPAPPGAGDEAAVDGSALDCAPLADPLAETGVGAEAAPDADVVAVAGEAVDGAAADVELGAGAPADDFVLLEQAPANNTAAQTAAVAADRVILIVPPLTRQ